VCDHDLNDLRFPDHHGDDHAHDEHGNHLDDAIWHSDNVELVTVGIDIGSSTSHLMFSRLRLARLSTLLSSRFVVVERTTLYRSPILLTPYRADNRIDAERLGAFIAEAYAQAGLTPDAVDSGAVILTGEALKRANARAIAELFAEQAGRFVCASAGHNLEAILAAHGSGAVALSRQGGTVLNIDVGGGTSKLAICQRGQVLDTAAIGVGGRLVALDDAGRVVRLEAEARAAAALLGISLALGAPLPPAARDRLAAALADALVALVRGEQDAAAPTAAGRLAQALLLTPPLAYRGPIDTIVFSGGVAEYLYGEPAQEFGDLARPLAAALRRAQAAGQLPAPVATPAERIRATVIGASQFTVQLSGNTVTITDPHILPLHNLPVLRPALGENPSAAAVAAALRRSLQRADIAEGTAPVAVALAWDGLPYYHALRALAEGIVAALPRTLQRGLPLTVVFDGDVGRTVGGILREELGVATPLICIDGVRLSELDYIDIGRVVEPANVVPVVVKSLLFPEPSLRQQGELLEV